MQSKAALCALYMQVYRMSYFRMPVPTLGEHHAGYARIPAHDHEEEDGHEGGAHLCEAAADTRRVEITVAYILQARFRTLGFRVPCAHGR